MGKKRALKVAGGFPDRALSVFQGEEAVSWGPCGLGQLQGTWKWGTQALRERETVELPGHPATSLYFPLSLPISGGTQMGTGLS